MPTYSCYTLNELVLHLEPIRLYSPPSWWTSGKYQSFKKQRQRHKDMYWFENVPRWRRWGPFSDPRNPGSNCQVSFVWCFSSLRFSSPPPPIFRGEEQTLITNGLPALMTFFSFVELFVWIFRNRWRVLIWKKEFLGSLAWPSRLLTSSALTYLD